MDQRYNYVFIWFIISLLSISCKEKSEAGITPLSDAEDKVGEVITVKGKVTGYYQSKGKGPALLNMGGTYPNQKLSLVFWASDLKKSFPSDFSPTDLLHKEVTASGVITDYKGKPQMVIKAPEQIGLKKRPLSLRVLEESQQPTFHQVTEVTLSAYYTILP